METKGVRYFQQSLNMKWGRDPVMFSTTSHIRSAPGEQIYHSVIQFTQQPTAECSWGCVRERLTKNPAHSQRLEHGQKQNAGPVASIIFEELKDVHTPLVDTEQNKRKTNEDHDSQFKISARHSHTGVSSIGFLQCTLVNQYLRVLSSVWLQKWFICKQAFWVVFFVYEVLYSEETPKTVHSGSE